MISEGQMLRETQAASIFGKFDNFQSFDLALAPVKAQHVRDTCMGLMISKNGRSVYNIRQDGADVMWGFFQAS